MFQNNCYGRHFEKPIGINEAILCWNAPWKPSVEEVQNLSLGFVLELKYTENELLFVPIIII